MHGVFHSLAHEGAAFLVLADKQRRAHVFARDHLRGMRREYHLVAFVGEVLQGHADKFDRLRVQIKFRRVDKQQGAAQVMVVVVLLDVGQVADKRHLYGALAAGPHAADVAFETVVLVDDLERRLLEERLESRDGDVELHAHAREQRAELVVHVAVEALDFGGLVVAGRAQHVAEAVQDLVELPAKAAFQRLENLVQQLGESLVPVEVPDGDGFGEHARERLAEPFARALPFLAAVLAPVGRDKCPNLHVLRNLAGHALHLLHAQHVPVQVRLDLGRLLFAQAVQHVLRDALENALHLHGDVRVVEVRDVEREAGEEPAYAHEDVRLSGVVVAYERGEAAQRERLLLDGTEVRNSNLGKSQGLWLHALNV